MQNMLHVGRVASGTIRKFRGVVATNDSTVAENTVAGGLIFGICQENVLSTDNGVSTGKRVIDIQVEGVARGIASAAIAVMAKVACGNDGRFATATTGQTVAGICTTAAAAANDQFEFEIVKGAII